MGLRIVKYSILAALRLKMEPVSSRSWRKVDPSAEEIGLLTLQHGNVDDQPRCDIEAVSLHTDPKYTALSYVWGNENDREDILIQRSKFRVTANLALALRYLVFRNYG